MKNYIVAEPFWHQGILQEKGGKLTLTDAAAKHIRHLLEEDKGEAEAEAAPASEPEAPAVRLGTDPEAVDARVKIASVVKGRPRSED